ncbi:tail fiber protein [Geobacillus thermoleovorans]|uniref:tail fiber protein n=1 Tax=Geobacillus thermoleovorans TaxID=33941 RepID=UPI003DA46CE7
MASNTPRLGLYKKDPVADANDTFNIQTMLNDNWDKIDSKVATLGPDGKIPAEQLPQQSLPTASTTQAGIVKLNTSTNSTSTTEAATPSAVKDVNDALAAHSADTAAHGIGDKSTLLTTNKNTIVEAINELFTFANDGKSSIAAVIGSPATNGDTFATLANHIQNAKNTMATNLTAKGTIASGTETLQALADKIANVVTGKYNVGDVLAPSALEGPVYKKVLYTSNVAGWTIDDSRNIYFTVQGTATVIKMSSSGTILWQVDLSSYFQSVGAIAVKRTGDYVFVGGIDKADNYYGRIVALSCANGSVVNSQVDRKYCHVSYIHLASSGDAIAIGWSQTYVGQLSSHVILAGLSGTTLVNANNLGNPGINNQRALDFSPDGNAFFYASGSNVYRYAKSGGVWNQTHMRSISISPAIVLGTGGNLGCLAYSGGTASDGSIGGYLVDFSGGTYSTSQWVGGSTYGNSTVHYFGNNAFFLSTYVVITSGGVYHRQYTSGNLFYRQQGNNNWGLIPLALWANGGSYEFHLLGVGYKILS